MKVIYEFDPYEDADRLAMAEMAEGMYLSLFGFMEELRVCIKHGPEAEACAAATMWRDKLINTMEHYGVDLDRVG